VPAPQVDFYVLPGSDDGARLRFACRLTEKAWAKRHRVRVQLERGEIDAADERAERGARRDHVHGQAVRQNWAIRPAES